MKLSRSQIKGSPATLRAAPFLIFLGLTFLQGAFGEASAFWMYAAKTVVGAAMIWAIWPWVSEMRWNWSWEAVVVGVGVFVLWVGLDPFYPKMPGDTSWNPWGIFGEGLGWFFIVIRLLGSTLVVPPLEEVFYRSLLYRYVIKPEFEEVSLGDFRWGPWLIVSVIFGLTHGEWLAGILCGMAYQGLVCWKKRLGDAMTAHAITNLLLGLWVVWRGEWHFW